MASLNPRPPYSEAELATLYPPALRLELVQVLLRHGERTPVTPRFANTGLSPFWPYCHSLRHLRSTVLDPLGSGSADGDLDRGSAPRFSPLAWKRRLEALGPDDSPVLAAGPGGQVDGVCDPGMLTDRGRETTLALGRRLRGLYVDRLGFLPARLASPESLYLRATPIPRALESLLQTLQGLYPPEARAASAASPTIVSRALADETLFPNDGGCRRFAALSRAFARRCAERWNESDEMAYVDRKIGRWMPPGSTRVAVDSHPRLIGIFDSINATDAHGAETRLPREFYDPKLRAIVNRVAVQEWFDGYKESQEYRALGIGSLLGDVVQRMVTRAEHNAGPRLGLSGCHDTTLAAILASLGAFDDQWPPFTSHIAIELFRRADAAPTLSSSSDPQSPHQSQSQSKSKPSAGWVPSFLRSSAATTTSIGRKPTPDLTEHEKSKLRGYFVRLRYNDSSVTIPGCARPGNHLEGDPSFCTLVRLTILYPTRYFSFSHFLAILLNKRTNGAVPSFGPKLAAALVVHPPSKQEAFKDIVDKFTPRDWKHQCSSTDVNAPHFPEKIQPAGY